MQSDRENHDRDSREVYTCYALFKLERAQVSATFASFLFILGRQLIWLRSDSFEEVLRWFR